MIGRAGATPAGKIESESPDCGTVVEQQKLRLIPRKAPTQSENHGVTALGSLRGDDPIK